MAQSPIHVTISDDATIEFVRRKVSSGEYASETDIIQGSLEVFKQESEERERWEREVSVPAHDRLTAAPHNAEVERWLKDVVGPRIDSFHANPSSGIPIDEVEPCRATAGTGRA